MDTDAPPGRRLDRTSGTAEVGAASCDTPGGSVRRGVEDLASALAEAAWLVALISVPVWFNVYSARSFEPDKAALLEVLSAMAGAAWLARVLAGGRVASVGQGRRSPGPRVGLLLPIAAVGVVATTGLATLLSVAPARSWYGSYFRQQGFTTLLALVVLAAATTVHLRREEQWRRAVVAIALGSVPVSVYAVVQRLGVDTIVPADDMHRVASSQGNPIFLGGYLAMAVLVTALGLAPGRAGGSPEKPRALRWLALGGVAALQLTALVLTQSRGPVLGLGAGVLAVLVAWGLRAGAGVDRRRRWSVVVAGLLVASSALAVLAGVAIPGSPLAGLRRLPVAGRLAGALDPASPTARVRLLIWRGVVRLETEAGPLRGAGGEVDRLHPLRPLVGYGPECFDLAFNRVFPPQLGVVEARDAIPDRAHCEAFDVLVTSGALGLTAWLVLVAGTLAVAADRAVHGAVALRSVARSMVLSLSGAAAVAVACAALDVAHLAGPLAPVGLLAGLCGAMAWGDRTSGAGRLGRGDPVGERIALVALGAVACHAVEGGVGIPVTATRLLLWFLVAALAAIALGRIRPGGCESGSPDTSRGRERLVEAFLAGSALAVAAYSLLQRTPAEVVARVVEDGVGSLGAALRAAGSAPVVVVVVGAIGAVAVLAASGSRRRASRRAGAVVVAAFVLPTICLAVVKARRLAETVEMQRQGAPLLVLSEHVARHAEALVAALVSAVLVLALLLVWGECGARPRLPLGRRAATTALVMLFVTAAAGLVARRAMAPIRADTLAKHAAAAVDQGQALVALELLSRASWLAPEEPAWLTVVARAAVAASRGSVSPEGRRRALDAAAGALERAQRMQPFDPDHPINLGRVLTAAAVASQDAASRLALLGRAEDAYRRGLRMRPGSILFRVEHAGVLAHLGRDADAAAELKAALALDPGFEPAAIMLAGIEHGRAVAALRAGRREEAARSLETVGRDGP